MSETTERLSCQQENDNFLVEGQYADIDIPQDKYNYRGNGSFKLMTSDPERYNDQPPNLEKLQMVYISTTTFTDGKAIDNLFKTAS